MSSDEVIDKTAVEVSEDKRPASEEQSKPREAKDGASQGSGDRNLEDSADQNDPTNTREGTKNPDDDYYGPEILVRLLKFITQNATAVIIFSVLTIVLPVLGFYISDLPQLATELVNPPTPTTQPHMAGEWNIAVARFSNIGPEPISQDDIDVIAEVFYSRLEADIADLSNRSDVIIEVWDPMQTGFIVGDTSEEREVSAQQVAKEINADVIVFGTVDQSGYTLLLQPEFFININNYYEAEEIVGHHSFGDDIPIIGAADNLPSQVRANRELSRRARSLSLIAHGLSLYFVHSYEDAFTLFEQANSDEYWQTNDGREVLYLFQGNAAGRAHLLDEAETAYGEAIAIEPEYSRGYGGLASVMYLRAVQNVSSDNYVVNRPLLDESLRYYNLALKADIQPLTADIPVKAAIGMGQVYLAEWFDGEDTLEQALEQFELVIREYDETNNERIREFASESHARLGLIYRQLNSPDVALQEFTTAIELSTSPSRRGVYWASVADIYAAVGQTELSANANYSAIEEIQTALTLTYQDVWKARYWAIMATRYERLEQTNDATEALQTAIDYCHNELAECAEYERQLEELSK